MLIHVLFLTLGTDMGDWMGTIETTGIGQNPGNAWRRASMGATKPDGLKMYF